MGKGAFFALCSPGRSAVGTLRFAHPTPDRFHGNARPGLVQAARLDAAVVIVRCRSSQNVDKRWHMSIFINNIDQRFSPGAVAEITAINAAPFTPTVPPAPEQSPGLFRFLAAAGSNGLHIWSRRAYEQDVVVGSGFFRKRFLLNGPKAIHRVLIENASNYVRTPATIRILGPITGRGLFLSEGEEWRHQRRTIAPALAPRVIPMLAQHIVTSAQETIARLAGK